MEYCKRGLQQFTGTCFYNVGLNGILLSPTLLQFAIEQLDHYEQNVLTTYDSEIIDNFYKNTTIDVPPTWENYISNSQNRVIIARFLLFKTIALYLCNYESLKNPLHYRNIPSQLCKYTIKINDILDVDLFNPNAGGNPSDSFQSIFKKIFSSESEFTNEVSVIGYNVNFLSILQNKRKFNKFILIKENGIHRIKVDAFKEILKYLETKGYFLDHVGIDYITEPTVTNPNPVGHAVLGTYCNRTQIIVDSQEPSEPYKVNWRNGIAIKSGMHKDPVKDYDYTYLLFVKLTETNNDTLKNIIENYDCTKYKVADENADECVGQILFFNKVVASYTEIIRKILFIPLTNGGYNCLLACNNHILVFNYKNNNFVEDTQLKVTKQSVNYDNTIYDLAYHQDFGLIVLTYNKVYASADYTTTPDLSTSLLNSYREMHSVAVNPFRPPNPYLINTAANNQTIVWANKNNLNAWNPNPMIDSYLKAHFKQSTHKGTIYKVIFHSKGELIASASADKTIRLWNVVTGLPIIIDGNLEGHILKGHTGSVHTIAFNNNIAGYMLISGSDDSTIRVWQLFNEIRGWECTKVIKAHSKPVLEVVFSPTDASLFASISLDNTVKLWDVSTYKCIGSYKSTINFNTIAFLPDGTELFAGNVNGDLYKFLIKEESDDEMSSGGKLKLKRKVKPTKK